MTESIHASLRAENADVDAHMATLTRKGSFVACRGECVLTVNWNRQSPPEH